MSTTARRTPNERSPRADGYSNSVTVTYVDAGAVRRDLRQAVDGLARAHPEIERVMLFGSFATGQAVPGSDLDLLIILSRADRPFLERIPLYVPEGCGVGVDVFPYTRAEIDAMLAGGNWFIRRALAEGVEVYPSS